MGLVRGLLIAGLVCASPAGACSMMDGYKVPTNLELAAKADTIVVATIEGERKVAEPMSGALLVRPTVLIKGAKLPDTLEVPDATIAGDPRMLRMVVASAPRELRAPNPGALIGGCVRYIFGQGMKLVLFLERDKDGKLVPYRSAFSRDAEDVADDNALWVKTVREYSAISRAPRKEWRDLLRARIAALRALADDADAQAIADDMAVELSGKRRPAFD